MDIWKSKSIYIKNGVQIAKKLSELYVTYRKKYIVQYYNQERKDFTYKEVKLENGFKDTLLLKHLRQQTTIGIFAGAYITSFICFDVDVPNKDMAKWTVYKLIYINFYIYIFNSETTTMTIDIFNYFTYIIYNCFPFSCICTRVLHLHPFNKKVFIVIK